MIKKSLYFFVVATLASIGLALLGTKFSASPPILTLLYSLGVTFAFLVFKGKTTFEKIANTRWLVLSCLLPILYIGVVYFIGYLLFDHPIKPLPLTFASIIPFILISSFFEELGWRGYLFKTLEKLGWFKMNLFVGFLWAAWHYPAILSHNYAVNSPMIAGISIFTLNVILLSFIFSWFRQKSGGIIATTLIHAFHNLAYYYWAGQSELSILSESGLVLSAVLIIVILALNALKKPQQAS